ncbi:hypothetical protein KSP39_PZI022096 [Platanthera zijinensis]|uniref:Transposase MuDR plant domain-containing protein n=1 Tax=Platanthera zijinensis TaxID=2320716 RepID=A0AAP0AYF6_9ASPA
MYSRSEFDIDESAIYEERGVPIDLNCFNDDISEGSSDEEDNICEVQERVTGIFENSVARDQSWVDRIVVDNSFIQFAKTIKDWVIEQDFDDENSTSNRMLDFVIPDEILSGLFYKTKSELHCAISVWSIKNHVQFKSIQSNQIRLNIKCLYTDSCAWKLRATKSKRHGDTWMISRVSAPHTCTNPINQDDHRQCTVSHPLHSSMKRGKFLGLGHLNDISDVILPVKIHLKCLRCHAK